MRAWGKETKPHRTIMVVGGSGSETKGSGVLCVTGGADETAAAALSQRQIRRSSSLFA